MERERPNILLLVLDSVRAKSFPLQNSKDGQSGTFQQLANRGIEYRKAIAPSAWTLPSHVSLFTGKLPSEHGITSPSQVFNPKNSLPKRLSSSGYRTYGISANPFIGDKNGFVDAFDEFRHVIPTVMNQPLEGGQDALELARSLNKTGISKYRIAAKKILRSDAPIQSSMNLILYKLSQQLVEIQRNKQSFSGGPDITSSLVDFIKTSNQPFFAFANYMEAHRPYTAPKQLVDQYYPEDVALEPDEVTLDPWAHMLGIKEHSQDEIRAAHGIYKAAIAYLDDQIKELLEGLEDEGLRDRTLVIVTSDHGEAFNERGRLDHNSLYQPVSHVPLIMDKPSHNHRVISTPVSIRSLYSTILKEAGIEDTSCPTLVEAETSTDPVISQYLELHIKNLARRFDEVRIEPFTERVQSVFGSEYQLIIGDRGTDELIPLDGSVDPEIGNEEIRDQLRSHLPDISDMAHKNMKEEDDKGGGPDEQLLRSLGYLE